MGNWFDPDDAVSRQRKRWDQLYPHFHQQQGAMPAGMGSGRGIAGKADADAVHAGSQSHGLLQNAVHLASSIPSRVRGSGSKAAARRLAAGSVVCPGRGKVERAAFLPAWMTSSWSYMDVKTQDWNHSIVPPTQVRDLRTLATPSLYKLWLLLYPIWQSVTMSCPAYPFRFLGTFCFS